MSMFQCVPNFSTCSQSIIIEIKKAIECYADVRDFSFDIDHNRSVITFIGTGEEVKNAVFAAAKIAIKKIDLCSHKGVHPRIGAIDVIPIVPIFESSMSEAVDLSYKIGYLISDLGSPVYFYENSAKNKEYTFLENIRKGGFEELCKGLGFRMPDIGDKIHSSAGAVVIGARQPLVAYNVNLDTTNVEIAKKIAHEIRVLRKSGDTKMEGIKAIGLLLKSSNTVQVSMNITRPEKTGVYEVFEYINSRAKDLGTSVKNSELIGVIPDNIASDIIKKALKFNDFTPKRILFK